MDSQGLAHKKYLVVDSNLYREDFIKLYQKCFSEPPYNEDWSYESVAELWDQHISNGLIGICLSEGSVIGFVTGYQASMKITDDIDQLLTETSNSGKSLDFDLETTVYVSELAVSMEYRRQGIAKIMTEHLFEGFKKRSMTHYFMRADLTNAHSVPLFVKYFGGKQMDLIVTTTENEILAGSTSLEKGYWYGEL
jgi:ribosomal protein S18 acetylase RimI-like enzyme